MPSLPLESVDAVLFDFDDTLYPFDVVEDATLRDLHRWSQQLRGLGCEAFRKKYDVARECVNLDLAVTDSTFSEKEGTAKVLQAASHNRTIIFGRLFADWGLSATETARLSLEFGEHYEKTFIQFMQEHYDRKITELLDDLAQADIKRALVTNYTLAPQLRKLVALGIDDRFEAIVTSEEAGADKPDSRVFEGALKKLGVSPARAVMVGDSYTDIVGAKALGIRTIWFKQTDASDGDPLKGVKPTARAADLSELRSLLLP